MRNRGTLLRTFPFLLVLALLGACSSTDPNTTGSETPTSSATETEDDEIAEGLDDEAYEGDGYEIHAPEDWDVLDDSELEEQQIQADVLFRNPEDDDGFFANININVSEVDDASIEDIVEQSKTQLVAQYPDYEFVTDEEIEIDGADAAHEFEAQFSYTQPGTDTAAEYHNRQWIILSDGTQYTVTATTSEDSWEDYEDIVEASFESFVVA